ncbi:MAG: nickel pincer cofactor biosynthesis protein LarC [Elusimicrobiota bacterium]|jgi:uncharacterized protein (TIGR00299 family) protein|nr:nickel pincer cofactor biosynthesis protein LarC [Elusimicrobiota bacterium]
MKKLYLECSMGASGDMIMAALYELIERKDDFLKQINSLKLKGVKVEAQTAFKHGIKGTHINVFIDGFEEKSVDIDIAHSHSHNHEHNHEHNHDHHTHSHDDDKHIHNHTGINDIKTIIEGMDSISQKVKADAIAIYNLIAQAESEVHGHSIDKVHFHEVGNLDAITDIVGVCILMEMLNPDEVSVSAVNTGSGFVKCAHGILPVPAPAAAYILKDIPIYAGTIKGELCTPTGAAIIKHFAKTFGQMTEMKIEKIGYGMGKKDFEAANCLRAFLGTAQANEQTKDLVALLECNLDDMTGEAVGFAFEVLFEKGALDVWTKSIYMKKNRPAILLSCLCDKEKADFFAELILKNTTSFGVRKTLCSRYKLEREISKVETPYGAVNIKTGQGYNVKKSKAEYEDIAKIALKEGLSFEEASRKIQIGDKNGNK